MPKQLIIVGAGGFGREVYNWACDVVDSETMAPWTIKGLLDSDCDALGKRPLDAPLLLDEPPYQPQAEDLFVIAIGDPMVKLRVADDLARRGARFTQLIHPTAIVGRRCWIGQGAILCPGAVVTADAVLDEFVTLNVHATVGHDARVGRGCTLSGHADVTGNVQLGEGVFLGSHAAVLPGVQLGDGAKVGAGSVVFRDVPAGTTVMGVPAKAIWTSKRASNAA